MVLSFYKYQGTGNDFIIVDNRKNILQPYDDRRIQQLCERRFGIGADGLILLQQQTPYDFEFVYHNADGSPAFCGNGSRCAVHLAQQLGIIDHKAHFLTAQGSYHAYIQDTLIHIHMQDAPPPTPLHPNAYTIHTGVPHYVLLVTDWEQVDAAAQGRAIRNQYPFQKQGINVNFVKIQDKNTLLMKTYERGVENETWSCGTGAVAAALVAATKGAKSPITVQTRGGNLTIRFAVTPNQHFTNIYLIGPAVLVFQGTIAF